MPKTCVFFGHRDLTSSLAVPLDWPFAALFWNTESPISGTADTETLTEWQLVPLKNFSRHFQTSD